MSTEECIKKIIEKHNKLLNSMTPGQKFRYYQNYGLIIDEKISKNLLDNGDITEEEYNENKLRIQEEAIRRTRRI